MTLNIVLRSSLAASMLAFTAVPALAETAKARFPGIGREMQVHLDNRSYEMRFARDGRTLHFRGIKGDSIGDEATVEYEALQLAPGVWRLTWQRPNPPVNVVHIENWNNRRVYVNSSVLIDGKLLFNASQGWFQLNGY